MKIPLIDIRPDHWAIVRDILQKHVPQYEVWAFGSRAKWTAKEYSDLDLAVIIDQPLSISVSSALADDFSESDLPFKVDVVDWATTGESFRQIIERDKVVVQKAGTANVTNVGRVSASVTRRATDETNEDVGLRDKAANPTYGHLGMAGEWTVKPLEDCMAALIDYRGKTPQKTSFGIPLITAKVVKGGRIEPPDEFIAVDDYEPWMRRGIPRAGDVVITTEAPLGEVAQLGSERVALAQRLIALRGKPGVLDNGFLKFLMQSDDVQDQLRARASGTTVLGIKQSELRKILLTLPPLNKQRAIAHILGTLDDKIELNRRMNETLEATARALFKSWFVDFDPVRAKAGLPSPSGRGAGGEGIGLPKPLADLFPDSFEDSAFGEIPKGWRVGRFGNVVEQLRGQDNPLSSPDALFHHFSIPAFDAGQAPKVEYGESIKSLKLRVPAGVILLSKLNPDIERVWMVDVRPGERAVCSTEFLVLRALSPHTRGYVYCLTRSPLFRQQIEGLVTGTSKSHQRAQVDSILNLPVIIPPSNVIAVFDQSADNLLARTLECRRESHTHAALRDTLLLMLISGELRVSDAEQMVKNA